MVGLVVPLEVPCQIAGIYGIFDGELYIGQTHNLARRIAEHHPHPYAHRFILQAFDKNISKAELVAAEWKFIRAARELNLPLKNVEPRRPKGFADESTDPELMRLVEVLDIIFRPQQEAA